MLLQSVILGLIAGSLFATIHPTSNDGRQVMALASLSIQVGAGVCRSLFLALFIPRR